MATDRMDSEPRSRERSHQDQLWLSCQRGVGPYQAQKGLESTQEVGGYALHGPEVVVSRVGQY